MSGSSTTLGDVAQIVAAKAAQLAAVTIPIGNNVIAFETDTGVVKVGDGTKLYPQLPVLTTLKNINNLSQIYAEGLAAAGQAQESAAQAEASATQSGRLANLAATASQNSAVSAASALADLQTIIQLIANGGTLGIGGGSSGPAGTNLTYLGIKQVGLALDPNAFAINNTTLTVTPITLEGGTDILINGTTQPTLAIGQGFTLSGTTLSVGLGNVGSVTQIVAGPGLTGGTITSMGTIGLSPLQAQTLFGNSDSITALGQGIMLSGDFILNNGTLSLANPGGGTTTPPPGSDNNFLLEDGSGFFLLEDSSGFISLESTSSLPPSGFFLTLEENLGYLTLEDSAGKVELES